MPDSLPERETKLAVPRDWSLPDLTDVAPGATVTRSTVHVTSTYYDTAELALLAHSVTLRRREGDTDAGWQLKVPGKKARTEIRVPLAAGTDVPARLVDLLAGIARGGRLEPVAEVRTERAVHRIEADGVLVEVADDRVSATASGHVPQVIEWREIEAEIVSGPDRLQRAIVRRLLASGASPAQSASKLELALGREPGPIADASDLIRAYLGAQVAALGSGDIELRRGLDPIHRTRVATRRFRSVLRVLAPVFEGGQAGVLDAELSWYQEVLGEVRDREVQRARFAESLAQLPPELVLGPVAADIEHALLTEQLAAREALMAVLASERYQRLLAAVVDFTRNPPVRTDVTITDVERLARKARRKARGRLTKGVRSANAVDLHRARKALKRSRYATELLRPVAGKSANRAVRADKRAQEVLGEHQDSVVAGAVLLRLGRELGTGADRNGFTYGVLWQREQDRARDARERAATLH